MRSYVYLRPARGARALAQDCGVEERPPTTPPSCVRIVYRYVYIYIYIYVCMCIYIYIYIYVYTYIYIYIFIFIRTHVNHYYY